MLAITTIASIFEDRKKKKKKLNYDDPHKISAQRCSQFLA